jgi:serine/threonine protein kinase
MAYKEPKPFGYFWTTDVLGPAFARKLIRVTNRLRETVENEARVLEKIKDAGGHKHIIDILRHDWLKCSANVYFIDMELGEFSLQSYIDYLFRNKDLPRTYHPSLFTDDPDPVPLQIGDDITKRLYQGEVVVNIAMQISLALTFLHGHCLVHRDLKPANGIYTRFLVLKSNQNLVLCYTGLAPPFKLQWKLTDFGITSEAMTEANRTVLSRGTEGYRAPEMLPFEDAHYSNRVDIWSLGCVLHELASGYRLFDYDYSTLRYSDGSMKLPLRGTLEDTFTTRHSSHTITSPE